MIRRERVAPHTRLWIAECPVCKEHFRDIRQEEAKAMCVEHIAASHPELMTDGGN